MGKEEDEKQRWGGKVFSFGYLTWALRKQFPVSCGISGEESTHSLDNSSLMTMLTSEMEIWMINEDMNYVWLEKSSTKYFSYLSFEGERDRGRESEWVSERQENTLKFEMKKNVLMKFVRWMDVGWCRVCVLQLNELQVHKRTKKFWVAFVFGVLIITFLRLRPLFMKLIRLNRKKFSQWEEICFMYLVDLPRPLSMSRNIFCFNLIFGRRCCVLFISAFFTLIRYIFFVFVFIHISLQTFIKTSTFYVNASWARQGIWCVLSPEYKNSNPDESAISRIKEHQSHNLYI